MDPLVAEWVRIAERDMRLARVALGTGDTENALYLCQQALEKALKAHIQAQTGDRPPKTHNLSRLVALSGWERRLSQEDREFLAGVGQYIAAARYGTVNGGGAAQAAATDAEAALVHAEVLLECLLRELK